jgi:hypothetical protein
LRRCGSERAYRGTDFSFRGTNFTNQGTVFRYRGAEIRCRGTARPVSRFGFSISIRVLVISLHVQVLPCHVLVISALSTWRAADPVTGQPVRLSPDTGGERRYTLGLEGPRQAGAGMHVSQHFAGQTEASGLPTSLLSWINLLNARGLVSFPGVPDAHCRQKILQSGLAKKLSGQVRPTCNLLNQTYLLEIKNG